MLKYLYLFAVISVIILAPFFGFIFWWLNHKAIKELLWHIDEVTTEWLYRLLDKVLGNIDYDWRKGQ